MDASCADLRAPAGRLRVGYSTAGDTSFVMGRNEVVYTLTYNTFGVIRPIFRITDMLGNVTTHQLTVSAVDPARPDLMLKDLWVRMLSKVRTGDVAAALTGITPGAQAQFRPSSRT